MRWVITLSLVCVFFSGCAQESEAPEPDVDTTTTEAPGKNETKNRLPVLDATVANLTVDVGAPIVLMLNGTDADGDVLNWTVLWGDGATTNGTVLPTEVNHTYDATGTYNITVTLRDGQANTSAQFVANVLAGAPPVPFPDDIVFSGHFASSGSETLEFELLSTEVSKVTFTMQYNEEVGGTPEVDNDLDWVIAGPGGQGGSSATYGAEPPITVNNPKTGTWRIDLDAYSVFPVSGCDWTVTVAFT